MYSEQFGTKGAEVVSFRERYLAYPSAGSVLVKKQRKRERLAVIALPVFRDR